MPTTRQALLLGLWSLVGILLLVAVPPWDPTLFGAGLEASAQALLHRLPFTDQELGRDVLLPYGPFGFLHTSYFDPKTFSFVLGCSVFFALLLGVGAFLATRGERFRADVPKALLFLLLPLYVRTPDGLVLALAVTYVVLRSQDGRFGLHGWEVPFLFALALVFHARLDLAVASTLAVLAGWVAHILRFKRPHTAPLLFLLLVVVSWWAGGQSFSSFPAWVRSSWELAWGQGDVLEAPRSTLETLLSLAGALGVLACAWRVVYVPRLAIRAVEIVTLLLLLGLSLSAPGPAGTLAPSELVLVLGLLLLARAWRHDAPPASVRAGLAAAGVALLTHLAVIGARPDAGLVAHHTREVARWGAALADMNAGLFAPPYLELTRRSERAAERLRKAIPLEELEGRVDVFGAGQAVALASGLDLEPRPVPQSHLACTPWLVHRNGDAYRGPLAPPTVVARIEPAFDFAPGMLDGEAFLELLLSYRFASRVGDFYVLQHTGGRSLELQQVLSAHLEPGEAVELSGSRLQWLWAELDLAPAFLGQLARPLVALPPVWLETRTRSGRESRHRLPVRAARGGFLLSPAIRTGRDFLAAQSSRRSAVPDELAVEEVRLVVEEGDAWAWSGAELRVHALSQASPEPPAGQE